MTPPLHRVLLPLLLGALPALAGEAKFLGEVRYEQDSRTVRQLNPTRFLEVGREWEPGDQKARLSVAHYQVLDVPKQTVSRLSIPLTAFRQRHAAVLNERAMPTLVHYDGAVSTLLFTQFRSSEVIATWLTRFDHRSSTFTDPVKLGDHTPARIVGELGVDPAERFLYFAEHVDAGGDLKKSRHPTSLLLKRLRLEDRVVDWELELKFPPRARPLHLTGPAHLFDPRGEHLALFEYDDLGGQRQQEVIPPAQVYVIDLQRKSVDTFPIPLSAYGRFFTPDGKQLVVGSHELGELVRINLETRAIEARVRGVAFIDALVPSPSGRTFLSFPNTELASPKVVELRDTLSLSLLGTIPMRLFVPGTDRSARTYFLQEGGRRVVFPSPLVDQSPRARALRIFELPDELDAATLEGVSPAELRQARAVVAARHQASQRGLHVTEDPRILSPGGAFAAVSVTAAGAAFVGGVRSGNPDGDYRPGRTSPVVLALDPSGKVRWERAVGKKGFVDYEMGGLAATPEGGCVVHVHSYLAPGAGAVARLVKLDAAGKVQWEAQLRGGGGRDTPVPHDLQLLPTGHISLRGHIALAHDPAAAWQGELDEHGKVVADAPAP